MKKAAALFLITGSLVLAGCGKQGGGTTPEPSILEEKDFYNGNTQIPITPKPENDNNATLTQTPYPTMAPILTMEPTGEAKQETGSSTTEKTENSGLVFATVTPVPAGQVESIAGKIPKEEFPVIDGSTATIPLSEAVYRLATGGSEDEAKQAISHTKTTNSYNRLYDGVADLLIVYEPAESIIKRMEKEPLMIKPIGLDALVFMANAKNPVESLTMEQLVGIYSGQVSNWSEVGGSSKDLLAFQRPVGSGSQTLMQKLVMGDAAMSEGDNVYRYSTMADILEGMLEYTGDDNTLGYSVFYYASRMYHLPDLKFMGVDGVLPSSRTIYDGTYPLINAFYAVIRPDEPEGSAAHRIFDWLTGREGQQMVFNLGYVPVIMPENADIDGAADAGNVDDIVLEPTADLKEGQHFIFFQKQNISDEFSYGKITIYDHTWKKCATFYNAMTEARGVWDGRYLSISQYRTIPGGEAESISRFYDLESGEFLEYGWLEATMEDGWLNPVSLLDQERGYFLKQLYEDEFFCRVIDINGKTVLDHIQIMESPEIYKQGNYFISTKDLYSDAGDYVGVREIYDRDFCLKHVHCYGGDGKDFKDGLADGVTYSWEGHGCVLSKDLEMLVDTETFLEAYGDGTDTACEPAGLYDYRIEGQVDWEYPGVPDQARLYRFHYKGKVYEVNRTMDFCWIQGEADGNYKNGKIPDDAPYYYVGYDEETEKNVYFSQDGRRLRMEDGTMPDLVVSCKEGFAMVKKQEDAVLVEEYLPGQGNTAVYRYPAAQDDSYRIYQVGAHCFATIDQIQEAGTDGKLHEVCFYNGGELTNQFTAKKYASMEEWYCPNHNRWETFGIRLSDGDKLMMETEIKNMNQGDDWDKTNLYRYGIIQNGELKYVTGLGVMDFYGDGYAQFTVGGYVYVYDPDGNIILQASNSKLWDD